MKAAPIPSSSIGSITTLAALALAISCVEGAEQDEGDGSGSGAATFDDGSDDVDDTELRTYEGVIANPAFGLPVRTGTTVGKTNEFTPSCGYSNNAPDVSFTWTAPSTNNFVFSTFGSSYDTILHVRSFTNSAQTLACNDNRPNSIQSEVSLDLTQGTTVIIVVDGYSNKSGSFKLNITKETPCLGGCDHPTHPCQQSTGTCVANGTTGATSCNYPMKPNFSPCDDGIMCTNGDYCFSNSCISVSPYVCPPTPPNDCFHAYGATCEIPTDQCMYNPKAAGTPCNDGDPCTDGDACNGSGTCVPQSGCDPTSENCNGWPGCCDPTDEYCATQEMNVGDPQGFAATPAGEEPPEPPPFEELDVDSFMALERQMREQGQ